MKDEKFKRIDKEYFSVAFSHCFNWVNQRHNGGDERTNIHSLRQCYGWKDAYVVLCKGKYLSVPQDVFDSIPSKKHNRRLLEGENDK